MGPLVSAPPPPFSRSPPAAIEMGEKGPSCPPYPRPPCLLGIRLLETKIRHRPPCWRCTASHQIWLAPCLPITTAGTRYSAAYTMHATDVDEASMHGVDTAAWRGTEAAERLPLPERSTRHAPRGHAVAAEHNRLRGIVATSRQAWAVEAPWLSSVGTHGRGYVAWSHRT